MIQTAALRHRLRVRRIGQTNRAIRIDDLDDFRRGGSSQPTFNPPIEAGKQHLIGLDDYRQPVRVEPGNPNNLRPVLTAGPYRALRITFEIQRQVKPRQWQTQN